MRSIRLLLFLQSAVFLGASMTHFGVLLAGYEHRNAGIAECVIGSVLLAGLVLTLVRPRSSRSIGIAVQGFALLGTAVGVVMVAIGVGPRTGPDLALHAVMAGMLLYGLYANVFPPARR